MKIKAPVRERLSEYFRSSMTSFKYSFQFARTLTWAAIVGTIILAFLPYLNSYGLRIFLNSMEGISRDHLYSLHVLLLISFFALVITLPQVLRLLYDCINKFWVFKTSEKLEALILKKKAEIDIALYESPDFQNLMQRAFHRGFTPLTDLTQRHFSMIRLSVSFVTGSILACSMEPFAYLILVVMNIPQLIIDYKYGVGVWNIRSEDSPEQRRFLDLRRHFNGVNLITETKLFQIGSKMIVWIQDILRRFHQKHSTFEKTKVSMSLVCEVIFFIGNAVCLLLIIRLFIESKWKIGDLVFAIGTFTATGSSIREFFLCINKQYEEHLSVRDIVQFLETPTQVSNAPGQYDFKSSEAPEIIFENVWFKYPSADKWILKGVSFKIDRDANIALIGPNGSGKSTIVKLLCKIYQPTRGQIYINGIDLEKISVDSWWSYLSVMLQDFADYNLLTKQAIAIGNIEKPIDDEKVAEAAYLSSASEFIEKWNKQYDMPLGSAFGGQTPSKGQRQKISLARTIYRDALLMILDEPTSCIDVNSVKFIAGNISRIGAGKSTIIVSHDIRLTEKCDKILLIEDGHITGYDTHVHLLQNEYYKNIN